MNTQYTNNQAPLALAKMPFGPVHATLCDGSKLFQMFARDLAAIPIWKGNRILDEGHVQFIKNTITNIKVLDMKPYHLVTYFEEDENGAMTKVSCIVDGQHRASVLRDYYNAPKPNPFDKNEKQQEEFQVFVIEKDCANEQEIIAYFNILNAQKSIEWREDPVVAANRYLAALMSKFNVGKKEIIRQGKTRFPYISIDALREAAITHRVGFQMNETPDEWSERIYLAHCVGLRELQAKEDRTKEENSALKAKCLLALGPFKTMQWMIA